MPRKRVRVSEHERRKPHQDQLTHVDMYIRVQDGPSGSTPGRAELGPRDIDEEVAQIEAIEVELHGEKRFCEICGREFYQDDMVRLPTGVWLCKDCDIKDLEKEVHAIEHDARDLGEMTNEEYEQHERLGDILIMEKNAERLWDRKDLGQRERWLGPISNIEDRTLAHKPWKDLPAQVKVRLMETNHLARET